ncbi:MAG: hypothetical protein C5B52_18795 [Bacteroidetes bacterium]|nr:MAG: hypothetical protein C5B52_18795 [Bacteroidota bacterium]
MAIFTRHKIFWLVIILLAIGGAGLYWYLKNRKLEDFSGVIKDKLKEVVAKASDSLYILDYDKLDIDLVKSQISLVNLHLHADSSRYHFLVSEKRAPDDVIEIKLKALIVDDITPAEILVDKMIDLKSLYVKEPEILIFHRPQAYNTKLHSVNYNNLYQHISSDFKKIAVGDIWFRNVKFSYHNFTEKEKVSQFKDVDFRFAQLLIDSTAHLDSLRFMYATNCAITIPEYEIRTADSMYRVKLKDTKIETRGGKMFVDTLDINPRFSEEEFAKIKGHQEDRLTFKIEGIKLSNMNWYGLLQDSRIQADSISVKQGNIRVYANRTLEPKPGNRLGTYPNQLLMKLKVPIGVRRIRLNKIDLVYREKSRNTGLTGEIKFPEATAIIDNVVNDPESIHKNHILKVDTKSSAPGEGSLRAVFEFDLANAKAGLFRVSGSANNQILSTMNAASKNLGMVTFDSEATIPHLQFDIRGNELSATSTVQANYRNLKLTMFKQDKLGDSLTKKTVINLLSSLFAKKDKDGVPATVHVQRDIYKSIFNLLWKSIFEGTKASLGIKK